VIRFARIAAASLAAVSFVGLAACGHDDQTVGESRPTEGASTAVPDSSRDTQGLGDTVTVDNQDGSSLLDFSLDRVVNTTCDQQAAQTQPTNGRFVTLNLSVATHNDPQGHLPGVELNQGWTYLGEDGKVLQANTPAAQTCHHEDLGLVPNRSYSTAVVLDVPADAPDDRVAYDVAGTHWEWKLES
jgi:hypothetical protein